MIDFLKDKDLKAYNELFMIAENPQLLFSNDSGQYNAEANYNLYTIQKLNKLLKKNIISVRELEQIFIFIESSWSKYLNNHYRDKSFLFYIWGDLQIPTIKLSVVSFYDDLELPFKCKLHKVHDIYKVLIEYKKKAQFEGVTIIETDESDFITDSEYILTVYSKIIKC